MGEETYDLEGGGGEGEMAFSDKVVRRGFIKKVYSIISVQVEKNKHVFYACCASIKAIHLCTFQLLVTFGFVLLFHKSHDIR